MIDSIPSILTIGNFDGLHRGHRTLIDTTIALSKSWGGRAVLMTFIPHPKQFFTPQKHFFIHPERERERLLDAIGVDEILYLPFTDIYQMTPRAFFDAILLPLNPVAIVLGDNFSFGKNKSGSIEDLRAFCVSAGIALHALPRTLYKGTPISSSRIRNAIQAGQIDDANHMLTIPYTLYGTVEHGAHRGRTLGFPTANIHIPNQVLPAVGVYASKVAIHAEDKWYNAMTAVTQTPSFNTVETVIENHILDFNGDIYDRPIRVALHHFVRPEIVFPSKESLIEQIHRDRDAIRTYFAAH